LDEVDSPPPLLPPLSFPEEEFESIATSTEPSAEAERDFFFAIKHLRIWST
jgi:hypothetical protein